MGRMPHEERDQYLDGLQSVPMKWRQNVSALVSVAKAFQPSFMFADTKTESSLQMLATMRKLKVLIREHRDRAQVVHASLVGWKGAGQCFMAFKKFAQKILKIQRWWRASS